MAATIVNFFNSISYTSFYKEIDVRFRDCGSYISFVLALLLASQTCLADLPESIQSCNTCHGPNGVASEPRTPHLNNQLPAYLADAMTAYAGGSRPTEISQHKTFPLADSGAMASFYGRQKGATRPKQELDPTIVVKGEKIYNNRCIDCHADGGRESDKDAPLVAGQNREFMVEQALLFKRGKRKFPFMMDDSYRGLSDEDLAAVAEYFAAQEQFSPQGGKKKKHK